MQASIQARAIETPWHVDNRLASVPVKYRKTLYDLVADTNNLYQRDFVLNVSEKMQNLPWDIKPMVCADFLNTAKKGSLRDANLLLADIADDCANDRVHDLRIGASDEFLRKWADDKAAEISKRSAMGVCYEELREEAFKYGFTLPWLDKDSGKDNGVTEQTNIQRLSDPKYWRRNAKRLAWRKQEALAIKLRQVRKQRDIYVSKGMLKRYEAQQTQNREVMQNTVAKNDNGYETSLQALVDASIANPKNREAELITRVRGFANVAELLGHETYFFTLTAPSKFHRFVSIYSGFGKKKRLVKMLENPKYDGSTPADAQRYLSKLFGRIRAKLNRFEWRTYGFRVVEAHHDGCPHWHFLLHMEKSQALGIREVFKEYAIREDSHEVKGRSKVRFDYKLITGGADGAIGYLIKYITKNLTGHHSKNDGRETPNKELFDKNIDLDSYGNNSIDSANKVQAWASCWGIRQFQQIGGASVTAWRELRRGANSEQLELFEDEDMTQLSMAATANDWAAYTLIQGGVFVKRDAQRVRAGYWFKNAAKTLNKYGEKAKAAVQGVINHFSGHVVLTKLYTWVIERKASKSVECQKPSVKVGYQYRFAAGGEPPPLLLAL